MLGLLVQTLTSLPPLVYVVIGLATFLYLKTRISDVPENVPPFPVKPYPLLGHLPMLSRETRAQNMHEWAQKTGKIFSLSLGGRLVIALTSLDVIREAFVKKADYFSDRPSTVLLDEEKESGQGHGILFNSGPSWKEQRTVSLSILRNFGMGKNWLAEKINEEVQAYLDALSKLKGQPKDVRMLTNASVSNVICAILIGDRFDLEDEYFTRMLSLLNEQVVLINTFSPVRVFSFLKYLPGDLFNTAKIKQNRLDMQKHFSARFVQEKNTGEDQDSSECFINAYHNEMKKKEKTGQSTYLNKENLIRTVTNLFGAGSETTSSTLLWGMLYALHHPQCVQKINQEIEEHIGYDRIPNIQDRPKMSYTNAYIMETQRMGSIVPFGVAHVCNETTEIAGYTIPKGTSIMPILDEVLKDPETWGDPLVFRPERFLDKDNKLVVPEEFIPFSLGRRLCLGESLAKMELFLFMTGIFQRFDLQPEDPANLPTLEPRLGITRGATSYKLKFVERS